MTTRNLVYMLTLVLFITCLLVHRGTERKRHVLIPMIIYGVVLATTFAWFVPELLSLVGTPYNNSVDDTLTSRGTRWQILSVIRGVILLFTAIFLLSGLTKTATRSDVSV